MVGAEGVITLSDMQADLSAFASTLAAGGLFGAAAGLLLVARGKVAGISGILAGALQRDEAGGWRIVFLLGLMAGGFAGGTIAPDAIAQVHSASLVKLALAGFLIGVGARLGNGCTSGHGICGVARFSRRSLVAVAIFSSVGALAHVALDRGGLG